MNNKNIIKLIAAASTVLPSMLFAQQAYQAPLVTESLLLDMTVNQGQLIAVGERGHVLRSEDGEQFSQSEVPSLATLTAVFALQNKVWAVGHDATILYSPDNGQSWQLQQQIAENDRPLMDVHFFDELHGIAVGAYGSFYRTTDGGNQWQAEMHPEFLHPFDQEYLEEIKQEDEAFYLEELNAISPHLNRISIDGERMYLAGEAGLLAYSDDQGKQWQRYEVDYEGSFFDIERSQSGQILAVGLRGNMFEYAEQGGSWQAINTCSQSSLNSIVSIDQETTLIVGNNGTLITLQAPQNQTMESGGNKYNGCTTDSNVEMNKTSEGKAVLDAVVFNNKLVAVTATGVELLELAQAEQ